MLVSKKKYTKLMNSANDIVLELIAENAKLEHELATLKAGKPKKKVAAKKVAKKAPAKKATKKTVAKKVAKKKAGTK